MRDPRRAYRVVDDFEAELEDYTGAAYAISVDSATNGILLALVYEALDHISIPRCTYVGVYQAALNAGYRVDWWPEEASWTDWYALLPTRIIDSARSFSQGMYRAGSLTVLSFNAGKQLPLGRGGAILTDDEGAAEWFKAARMDGRPPGAPVLATITPGFHAALPPDTAALGLWILSRWNDADWSPAPLPSEDYPDLSLLASTYQAASNPPGATPTVETVQSGSDLAK